MFFSLLLILLIFVVAMGIVWLWYFKYTANPFKALYRDAMKVMKNKDYKHASELLQASIEANPDNKDARYALGVVSLELNDLEKAAECFENVLKTSPKDFNALMKLAKTSQLQNNNDKAEELYSKALQENPNSVECQVNLGLIQMSKNNLSEALSFFEKAKEISPDNVEANFYLNKCKDEMCNYEDKQEGQKIIDEYLKLADSKELPLDYYITLTKAQAKMGQLEDALKSCQKALVKNSEDAEAHKLLGLMQLVKKDLVGAKNSLSTALNLKAKNQEVHELLSYVLCQQNDRCLMKKCREKYKELTTKIAVPK